MSSLTVVSSQVTIMDINVRVLDGLFSLNDLHKASGGNPKHKPAFFLRTDQTKDIVTELHKRNSPENTLQVKRGGHNQGTWVCKELVYSYAMWISAKFHIAVIHTFDDIMQKRLAGERLNGLCYDLTLVKDSLTHAGRYLSVGGKQIKPALEKQINLLMQEIQPQLPNIEVVK